MAAYEDHYIYHSYNMDAHSRLGEQVTCNVVLHVKVLSPPCFYIYYCDYFFFTLLINIF